MGNYKHIEEHFSRFIIEHYRSATEVGVGRNFTVAESLAKAGVAVRTTDIFPQEPPEGIAFLRDDVCAPDTAWYRGSELIYAVRPGIEMMPCIIALARSVNADCVIYHLGNEIYERGGRIIDCGVVLHQYYSRR
ncbi:UPF0146 family protein [Methanogenium organophilum]|uniref:UPF0146 protein OU421_03015 n=1 Tax=Methanogenium organophilum TaxID=2199 RepID=A0A9X9S5J7_METOG|nr:UPF0146 family protein [Methanogenium organophilum]WAI01860.1 UPF0146 family protein [Methanogenium organophilum]